MSKFSNPFNEEEVLTPWFEQDKFYVSSKRSGFKELVKIINYKPTFFMSLKQSYLNIINTITKHAILATLIMLVALGGVGASAAQLIAPDEYKPSTLIQKTFNPQDFETNSLPEKNPYTALVPDDKNDVATLDTCDMSIKYPKVVNDTKVQVFSSPTNDTTFTSFTVDDGVYRSSTWGSEGSKIKELAKKKFNDFSLACQSLASMEQDPYLKGYRTTNQTSFQVVWSKEDLKKNLGWFVTEAELTDILFDQNGWMPMLSFNFKDKNYRFQYRDQNVKSSDIKDKDPELEKIGYYDFPGIFGNQIQLQFNSLVENKPNAEIIDEPKNSSNSSSTSSVNPQTTTPRTPSEPSVSGKNSTYTNPSLPNLKLVYDDSWTLSTEEYDSNYSNLKDGKFKLQKSKNGIWAEILIERFAKIEPSQKTLDSIDKSPFKKVKDLGNGVYKYEVADGAALGSGYYYFSEATTFFFTKSNLPATNYPEYSKNVNNEDSVVTYVSNVSLTFYNTGPCNQEFPCFGDVDPTLEKEADQILAQSNLAS